MRSHALAHRVKEIALPKIGCGLDLLQWPAVRTLIKNVFQYDAIQLSVYILEKDRAAEPRKTPADERSRLWKKSGEDGSKAKEIHTSDHVQKKIKGPENRQPTVKDYIRPAVAGSSKISRVQDRWANTVDIGFGHRVRRPLPDVFSGLRIVVPKHLPEYDRLRRHIVGFGGECLESADQTKATAAPTHIVYDTGTHICKI
jgi:hypothetical protein